YLAPRQSCLLSLKYRCTCPIRRRPFAVMQRNCEGLADVSRNRIGYNFTAKRGQARLVRLPPTRPARPAGVKERGQVRAVSGPRHILPCRSVCETEGVALGFRPSEKPRPGSCPGLHPGFAPRRGGYPCREGRAMFFSCIACSLLRLK